MRILPKAVLSIACGTALLLHTSCTWRPAPRNAQVVSPRKENIRQLDHAAPIEERPAAREITAPSHLTAEEFDRFRKEIQRFYLAPYLWGGASPAGTDCSGLVRTIYRRAADINLPHSTQQLFQVGDAVKPRELKFADLLFFRFKRGSAPDHVGLYIANRFFLHASVSQGVVLSRLTDSPYAENFVGAKRIMDGKNGR
ncbi:MAG TPA: C40 family peptidase [bacterium]|nr:C40 family peptidase [bacterium]HNT64299.1 C40 family peptidase [bacterium]HOX85289.1 C40 family peptidase [bacterium]HPG44448.1 C40 family peptidase [bacterium]HPM97006.1 C40 family peptidase [bacterium]